jgi:hypothetical protein
MESIRQGAHDNSKSLQANGLLQSHKQYNTAQKIIGEIILGCGNHVVFTRQDARLARIEGLPA